MRFLLLIVVVSFIVEIARTQPPISVSECNVYTNHVTQAELNAYRDHFGACMLFGGTQPIHVSGNAEHIIYSSNQIQLKENFYAGNFSSSGEMRLIVNEPGVDVVVMNYPSLNQVLRYKKFELGIALPSDVLTRVNNFLLNEGTYPDELNPFLEWDLDVEAIFYHPSTGVYKRIDGYYHREYTENPVTNDWDDIGTDYPFRVRFAPPQNGKWIASIIIKINGQEAHRSEGFGFNVIESGDPGYVHVFPNKKNLKRGNKMIFPVGHNFFDSDLSNNTAWGGSSLGNNLFETQNTKASNTLEWDHYLNKIENYFQSGGKYIRTLQSPWVSLIEFEKKGNYYDRLHYAWEQDKLLDLCEQYDALMMFNMLIHHSMEEYAGYGLTNWDWGREEKHWQTGEMWENPDRPVYCYNDSPGKKPHESFLLEEDLKYHEQRTRYYIARYGYSTKIYEFELLSEPFNVNNHYEEKRQPYFVPIGATSQQLADQQTLFNAIENYHGRLGNFIKVTMGHTEHLLGVNYSMGVWKTTTSAIRMDQSLHHETIDIIGINDYALTPHKYVKVKSSSDNHAFGSGENSTARAIKEFQNWANKPIIFSEFGDGDGTYTCSDYKGVYVDLMSAGFTGVCGFNMWPGTESNQSFLYPATVRAQNHMNGNEVISTLSNGFGSWSQGRQAEKVYNQHEAPGKELQYYVASNKESAVGYIRNRSYNVHTNRTNNECNILNWNYAKYYETIDAFKNPVDNFYNIAWDYGNNNLKLQGLKSNTNYQIDWYSFKDGWYLGSDCRNTTFFGTELTLRFPKLFVTPDEVERPMVWFVARQTNCMVGMMPVDEGVEAFLLDELNQLNEIESPGEQMDRNPNTIIYPNPFDNYFTIESTRDDVLIIQEVNGKIVREEKVSSGKTTINSRGLSNGVYIVTLVNQGIQNKMIKQ